MDSTKALNAKALEAARATWPEPWREYSLGNALQNAIRAYLAALSEQGEATQPAADGLEPSHWHCKDYADGWISFDSAEEALAYQRETGCLLRVVYRPASPGIASQAEEGSE